MSVAQTLYYEATCALHSGDKDGAAKGFHNACRSARSWQPSPSEEGAADRLLMLALARCGDHAGAAKIAKSLVAVPPKDEAIYVQAACGYALAAGAAAGDAGLVKRYTDRAIDCVRTARKRGWADVVSLEPDTDLEPIRKDPAFQALLAELRQPGEKRH